MFELLGSAVVLNAGVVWRGAGGLEVGGQEGGGGLAGARGHRLQQLQHTLGVLLVAQQRQILPLQIGDIALRRHIVEVRELKPIVRGLDPRLRETLLLLVYPVPGSTLGKPVLILGVNLVPSTRHFTPCQASGKSRWFNGF